MVESEDLKLFNTAVPLIGLAVLVALGVILMVQQFQRSLFKQRISEENLKVSHQRELLRTAISVQEQERRRIAGDLHDELGARLSLALLLLKQEPGVTSGTSLWQVEEHLNQALSATKRISYELMPPQLVNLGLYRALLVLVSESRRAGTIEINLARSGAETDLPWPVQVGIYRIVTELLNNTLKHASATLVNIELRSEQNLLHCSYNDNGRGLPPVPNAQGLGLQNLEGRTTALNGSLEYGNAPEGGFFAKISIPVSI